MTNPPPLEGEDLAGGTLPEDEKSRISHLNELRRLRRFFQVKAFWGMAIASIVFLLALLWAVRHVLMPCTLQQLAAGGGHLLFLVGGCLAILTLVPLSLVAGVIRLSEDAEHRKATSDESLLKMPVLELLKAIKELFKKDKD